METLKVDENSKNQAAATMYSPATDQRAFKRLGQHRTIRMDGHAPRGRQPIMVRFALSVNGCGA